MLVKYILSKIHLTNVVYIKIFSKNETKISNKDAFHTLIDIYNKKCASDPNFCCLIKAIGIFSVTLKLILSCIEYSIITIIRFYSKQSYKSERLLELKAAEFSVLLKMLFPVFIFITPFYDKLPIVIILIILLVDSINTLVLNLVVLNDRSEASPFRSLLLLFINYIQFIFSFVVFYKIISINISKSELLLKTILLSSDFYNTLIKHISNQCYNILIPSLLIGQFIISLLMLTVGIGYFVNRLSNK